MIYETRKIQYYIPISVEAQSKELYRLSVQLFHIPERVKPFVANTTPAFVSDKVE